MAVRFAVTMSSGQWGVNLFIFIFTPNLIVLPEQRAAVRGGCLEKAAHVHIYMYIC